MIVAVEVVRRKAEVACERFDRENLSRAQSLSFVDNKTHLKRFLSSEAHEATVNASRFLTVSTNTAATAIMID